MSHATRKGQVFTSSDASENANRYRHLALRVISLAFRDMASLNGTAEDRASARTFLAGSVMFRHWCAVARLDPRRVMRQAIGPKMHLNGISLTEEVKWRQ